MDHANSRDNLSKAVTTSVNGTFIMIVFFSHVQQYIRLPVPVHSVTAGLGQLMVAMFLFYSGYGVGSSIHKKGMEYVHGMPRRRILQVLGRFIPAVLLYALVDLACGITFYWQGIAVLAGGVGESGEQQLVYICDSQPVPGHMACL